MKKLSSFWIKIVTFSIVLILALIIIPLRNDTINNKNIYELCLGNKNAKHTLIFYYSLECEYCKEFFLNIIPHIKKTYVKNNYIKIIFKEIPLNNNDIDFFIFAKSYDTDTYIEILSNYYKNYFKTNAIEKAISDISEKIHKKIYTKKRNILRKNLKLAAINFIKNTANSLPYFVIDNQKFDYFLSKKDLGKIISGEIVNQRN